MNRKRILITGAGSGFGELAAIGLAKDGHDVIAGVQIWPQATALRRKVETLGLKNLQVEKLDLLHPYDVQNSLNWDIDTLVNNAAIAESGPITEIPMELLRRLFDGNFFAPLELTQRFVRKFIDEGRPGKIVFTSSIGGLISIPYGGPYAATKHALEAIAGSMQAELAPFGIQVQVINPGGYLTGFNETEAESSSHWMDDRKNYVKRVDVQGFFARILGDERNRLDPQLMADAMVQIIPRETGLFRNVVPQLAEDMVKALQRDTWTSKIDLPSVEMKKTV
ncbi:MAG TPA: SDR family oxidoreductase [Vicinamibacterales bacterium]|jgi:short-subunit dehydrogenase|nr:SDR family oxidoreductase [Vicinamibacterales bacterium]